MENIINQAAGLISLKGNQPPVLNYFKEMIKIRKKSELSVITNAKKLANYVITITEKSPKKFRYSFVLKLHNLCIDLIENLYFANSIKLGDERRRDYQLKSFTTLKLIDSISLMAYESKCILFKQY